MNYEINNGERLQVSFGNYRGIAGVSRDALGMRVSFFTEEDMRKVKLGNVDGQIVAVMSVQEYSNTPERRRTGTVGVPGMVTLTVVPHST